MILDADNIKTNLSALRKDRKISQKTLADFLHVSPQTVSGWENGYFYPDIPQIINAANYFGVTVDCMFVGGDRKLDTEYDASPETLGKTISELRKSAELTQKGLADKLYVSPQAVSRWERGQGYPDLAVFPTLIEVFDCSLHALISGEAAKKEEHAAVPSPQQKSKKPLVAIVSVAAAVVLAVMGALLGVFLNRKEDTQAPMRPENVILINTYEELMANADSFTDSSAYFVIQADITATEHVTIQSFNAMLDGGGHTVNILSAPFIKRCTTARE